MEVPVHLVEAAAEQQAAHSAAEELAGLQGSVL